MFYMVTILNVHIQFWILSYKAYSMLMIAVIIIPNRVENLLLEFKFIELPLEFIAGIQVHWIRIIALFMPNNLYLALDFVGRWQPKSSRFSHSMGPTFLNGRRTSRSVCRPVECTSVWLHLVQMIHLYQKQWSMGPYILQGTIFTQIWSLSICWRWTHWSCGTPWSKGMNSKRRLSFLRLPMSGTSCASRI